MNIQCRTKHKLFARDPVPRLRPTPLKCIVIAVIPAFSAKVTTSSTSASVQMYSDRTCTTAYGSAIVSPFTPTCVAQSMASVPDEAKSYSTVGYSSSSPLSAPTAKKAGCFAASETVQMEDGSIKALSEVQLGDRILTAALDGSIMGSSLVIAVPHAGDESVATFVHLTTAETDVKMTPSHLVLAGSCAATSPLALVQARSVQVGHRPPLTTSPSSSPLRWSRVKAWPLP